MPDGRYVMLLESPLTTLPPEGGLMMSCDSVAFPPGGCAYSHTHRGPGIRCLREGTIRIDSDVQSHHYGPGEPWFEAGPIPVFAQADAARDSGLPAHLWRCAKCGNANLLVEALCRTCGAGHT